MPTIYLTTQINATIERVFDLARSIDLHMQATAETEEKAIAGRTSGLIVLNETVTWRAKHFGIHQKLTSKITALERPIFFRDQMIKGIFAKLDHCHGFEERDGGTKMTDILDYKAPLGILGKAADSLFLKEYLTKFILQKNKLIKSVAESDKWKDVEGMR